MVNIKFQLPGNFRSACSKKPLVQTRSLDEIMYVVSSAPVFHAAVSPTQHVRGCTTYLPPKQPPLLMVNHLHGQDEALFLIQFPIYS